jgi:hypothetical protein
VLHHGRLRLRALVATLTSAAACTAQLPAEGSPGDVPVPPPATPAARSGIDARGANHASEGPAASRAPDAPFAPFAPPLGPDGGGGAMAVDRGAPGAPRPGDAGRSDAPPVPTPTTPAASATQQLATVKRLAALVCRMNVTYDEADNVVALNFSNHPIACGPSVMPRGLTDEHARELLQFPELKRVRFEKMPMALTAAGYQTLARIPGLEAALFAYVLGDPTFMHAVRDHRHLKVLELKHLFQIEGTRLAELPSYDELRVLELDVDSAARAAAVPFIKRHPKLISLQLHRTTITNADMGEIVAAVPDLEGLELKPAGSSLDDGVFIHVGKLKRLKVLQLTNVSVPSWDAGGKFLGGLAELRVIKGAVASDTVGRLEQLIPGLAIGNTGLSREQQEMTNKDNLYFLRAVTPWFVTGRKQEYRFGQPQSTVRTEDGG